MASSLIYIIECAFNIYHYSFYHYKVFVLKIRDETNYLTNTTRSTNIMSMIFTLKNLQHPFVQIADEMVCFDDWHFSSIFFSHRA